LAIPFDGILLSLSHISRYKSLFLDRFYCWVIRATSYCFWQSGFCGGRKFQLCCLLAFELLVFISVRVSLLESYKSVLTHFVREHSIKVIFNPQNNSTGTYKLQHVWIFCKWRWCYTPELSLCSRTSFLSQNILWIFHGIRLILCPSKEQEWAAPKVYLYLNVSTV
jgi:hypothetical protein